MATELLSVRLKRFREATGLTQAQVRDELKLGRVAMSEYENGKTNPSEDVLERLANLYGTSVQILRYGESAMRAAGDKYWAGYADAILSIMESVTNKQRHLVNGLRGEASGVDAGVDQPSMINHEPVRDPPRTSPAAPPPPTPRKKPQSQKAFLSVGLIDADIAAAEDLDRKVKEAQSSAKRRKETGS